MKEFKPGGWYSLLTDKDTVVLARKPDGSLMGPVSGGCTTDTFCNQAQPFLKRVIQARSGDESKEPTAKQQKAYKTLWEEGHVRITDDGHAKNVFVMPSDWQDIP